MTTSPFTEPQKRSRRIRRNCGSWNPLVDLHEIYAGHRVQIVRGCSICLMPPLVLHSGSSRPLVQSRCWNPRCHGRQSTQSTRYSSGRRTLASTCSTSPRAEPVTPPATMPTIGSGRNWGRWPSMAPRPTTFSRRASLALPVSLSIRTHRPRSASKRWVGTWPGMTRQPAKC